jgi:hypothetical protein
MRLWLQLISNQIQHPRDREETKKKWNNLSSDATKSLKEHKKSLEQTGIILFD